MPAVVELVSERNGFYKVNNVLCSTRVMFSKRFRALDTWLRTGYRDNLFPEDVEWAAKASSGHFDRASSSENSGSDGVSACGSDDHPAEPPLDAIEHRMLEVQRLMWEKLSDSNEMRADANAMRADQAGCDDSLRFSIQESNVKGAGKGLFALVDLEDEETILFYEGRELSWSQAKSLADKSYLMFLGQCERDENGKRFTPNQRCQQPEICIDARETPQVLARYINDCRNPKGYNVKFVMDADMACARIVTLRPISAGEELFVDYGERYWSDINKPQSVLSEENLFAIWNARSDERKGG